MLIKGLGKNLSLQYITNEQGEKTAVVLPIEEFKELLIALEDLETSAELYAEIYEKDKDS